MVTNKVLRLFSLFMSIVCYSYLWSSKPQTQQQHNHYINNRYPYLVKLLSDFQQEIHQSERMVTRNVTTPEKRFNRA